jgi:hypothetical protein
MRYSRMQNIAIPLRLCAIAIALGLVAIAQIPASTTATPETWKSTTLNADPRDLNGQQDLLHQKRALIFNEKSNPDKKPLDSTKPVTAKELKSSNFAPAFLRMPPIPVQESDTVIVGQLVSLQPHFSADHTHLYTEMTIQVEERMKGGNKTVAGQSISIVVGGGRLRLPDGREISENFVPSNYRLAENTRYVMFLNYYAPLDCFQVVKTWELQSDKVIPTASEDIADARQGSSRYSSLSEATFLQAIKEAVESTHNPN